MSGKLPHPSIALEKQHWQKLAAAKITVRVQVDGKIVAIHPDGRRSHGKSPLQAATQLGVL